MSIEASLGEAILNEASYIRPGEPMTQVLEWGVDRAGAVAAHIDSPIVDAAASTGPSTLLHQSGLN